MNSIERFNTIINGGKPDKMPLYIPTIACSVASEILGRKVHMGADSLHFKEELALYEGKDAYDEFEGRLIEDTIELYNTLRVDVVRETWRSKQKATKKLDDYTLLFGDENGKHMIKRFFPESQSYGIVKGSSRATDVDELVEQLTLELEKKEVPTDEQIAKQLESSMALYDRVQNKYGFIAQAGVIGVPMHEPTWLEAVALEPELLHDLFIFRTKKAVREIELLYMKGIKWVNGGRDIASNEGPIYSPQAFKNIMVDALKIIADACAKRGMVYCYRTDGNTWPIFDYMFMETGIQAYGEVDIDAGMRVGKIRNACSNLVILGNISSALLANGSKQAVKEQVKSQLEESGGRYFIPGPSNAVVHGTPPENVFAMIEAIEEFKP